MIKGIIFDYDGVIADSNPFYINRIQKVAAEYGLKFSIEDFNKYFAGFTLALGSQKYLSVNNLNNKIEEFIKRNKDFDHLYPETAKPYNDVLQFILNNHSNYKMAICTGGRKALILPFLKKYEINKLFEFILDADDYQKSKPDPEAYLLAADKLGLKKEEIVVIEDNPRGIFSAKGAGLKCIAVTHTEKADKLKEADYIVSNINEIDLNKIN